MYELANDEHGQPFDVPPAVWGWQVARTAASGPGRPAVVYSRNGKPLVVGKAITAAELLELAGPGRYRLKPVDQAGREIRGVPTAWTGPLESEADDEVDAQEEQDAPSDSLASVVVQLAATNAQMAMSAMSQTDAIMRGVANLMNAQPSGIGQATQPPSPTLRLVAVNDNDDDDDDEYDDDEDQGSEAETIVIAAPAPTGQLPEVVQHVIKQFSDSLVRLLMEKLGNSGIPLEALLDWRKAAPSASPPQSVVLANAPMSPHSQVSSPTVGVAAPSPVSAPPNAGAHAASAAPAFASVWPYPDSGLPHRGGPQDVAQTAGTPVVLPALWPSSDVPEANAASTMAAPAGAAPSVTAALGAVPAAGERVSPPVATSQLDASATAGTHTTVPDDPSAILGVWWALSDPEREHARRLIERLPDAARQQLITELAVHPPEQALARARSLLRGPAGVPTPR